MNNKNNLVVALRFIVGLSIIGILELIAAFVKHSPMFPFYSMVVMPVFAVLFLPPIISAIYFMFSSKIRWRIDILLLIVSVICLVVFYNSQFNFQ